jgi:hypothetical protein
VKKSEFYENNKLDQNKKRIEWRNASENNKKRDRSSYLRWVKNNPEKYKEIWKRTNRQYKEKVLLKICDNLKCRKCKCDKLELLEINHINGGGSKEIKKLGNNKVFYRKILDGTRSTTDLEMKFGELPYKLTWENIDE